MTSAMPARNKMFALKRFSARSIDYVLFSFFLDFIPGIEECLDEYGVVFNLLFYLCAVPLIYIPFEAAQIHFLQRSIGKYFFGLKITYQASKGMPWIVSIKRSFLVYWRGMAAAIPFLEFVALYLAYRRLRDEGDTSWDRDMLTTVSRKAWGLN